LALRDRRRIRPESPEIHPKQLFDPAAENVRYGMWC